MMAPETDGHGPATGGEAAAAAQADRTRRVIQAFGRRNVAYLWSVMAAVASVPVFNAIDRASGTLGPDRLGGEVGSVLLWAVGSLMFFGVNALQILGWLVGGGTKGPAAKASVSHAAIGCALPFATLLAGVVGAGVYDGLTSRPGSITNKLAAAQEIGSIAFPAGSVVETESAPPGRVVRGYATAPTVIAGLTVVGEFELSFDGSGSVRKGRLAAAQPVDSVPCGPGVFHREGGYVECTLAEPVVVNGATLAAGQQAGVDLGRDGVPARFGFGVLAGPARVGNLDCAPGEARSSDRWDGCVLARDQDVGGFWLMGGTNATLFHEENGSTNVGDGAVLARPLEAFGVTLPRGTAMTWFLPSRPEELRDGRLPIGAYVTFRTPDGAVVPIRDGEVHGRMDVKFGGGRIEVSNNFHGGHGVFLLDGHRVRGARFDQKEGGWQIYSADD